MGFTIPNEDDASYADQAVPDSVDFEVIAAGVGGDGVVFGGEVTAGGGMTVDVSAVRARIGDVQSHVAASNDLAIGNGDASNPRFDLVVTDGQTISVTAGTADATPVFPKPAAGDVVLAAVYVPANESTAITAGMIVDKRMFVTADGRANILSPATGVSADGTTDDAAALDAALSAGGYWFFPRGTYAIDTPLVLSLSGNLDILGESGALLACTDDTNYGGNENDLISINTAAFGIPLDLRIENITFDTHLLPGSDSNGWPYDDNAETQWPHPNGLSTSSATGEAISMRDGTWRTIEIVGCDFYAAPPRLDIGPYHWTDGGGDSLVFVDVEKTHVLRIQGCSFYGARDSATYLTARNAGLGDWSYRTKMIVSDNYFEGCGNGVHVKVDVVGAVVTNNVFVNCANAIGAQSQGEFGGQHIHITDNVVDGYDEGITIREADGCTITGNQIFNGGHMILKADGSEVLVAGHSGNMANPDPTDLTKPAITDDFFDSPVAIAISGGSNNLIEHNYIEGSAIDGLYNRQASWTGTDPWVFLISEGPNGKVATDNVFRNNTLRGDLFRLVNEIDTSCENNVVSWSDRSHLADHTLRYSNRRDGSRASGPVADVVLSTDVTSESTSLADIAEFTAPVAQDSTYGIRGVLYINGPEAGDIQIGWTEPGTATGFWTGHGLATSASGNAGTKVAQASDGWSGGANKLAFGTAGTGANDYTAIIIEGTFNADTAGDLVMRLRQGVAQTGNPACIKAGSRLTVERLT